MVKRGNDKPANAQEETLWQRVIKTVNPLAPEARNRYKKFSGNKPNSVKEHDDKAGDKQPAARMAGKPTPSEVSSGASSKTPSKPAASHPPVLQKLDRNEIRRVSRKAEPLAKKLDLHGLTLAESRPRLVSFIKQAQGEGHKFVLVITGKGRRGEGALRRDVPIWLHQPELAALIVGFETARPQDGGDGALYVRLRKLRKATEHQNKE